MDTNKIDTAWNRRVADYSRYRLFLVSSLIIFACLVGFALWTSYASQVQLRNTARELFTGESAKRAMAVSFYFSKRVSELGSLAASGAVRSLIAEAEEADLAGNQVNSALVEAVCERMFQVQSEKFVGSEKVFSRIALLDSGGRLLVDTDSECLLLEDYNFYELYVTRDAPRFFSGESGGVMCIVVSLPVTSSDGNMGSVVGWVRVESLYQSLGDMTVSPSVGSDFLRIGKGLLAVSDVSAHRSGQLLLMNALREWEGLTVLKAGRTGREQNYLAISSPVQGTSLSIISLVEEKRIFGFISLKTHLFISLFIFLVVTVGCYLLVRTIFKRQIYETKAYEAAVRESEINLQKEKLEQEIKNRRLADALRKRAEIRYRDIFDNAPVGIFQITLEGRYLTANGSLARIFGYADQNDLIESVNNVRNEIYVHPGDWDRGIELLQDTGQLSGYEVECRKKDGGRVWTSRDFRLVEGEPGFPAYIEGFVTDISMRKAAEEKAAENQLRLSSLFENSPVALWEMDFSRIKEIFDLHDTGKVSQIRSQMLNDSSGVRECIELVEIIMSNNLASEFLRARSGAIPGKGGFGPYVNERTWLFFRAILLDFASGKTRHRSEIHIEREEGGDRYLIINCNIVPGNEKTWKSVLGTVEDISEMKRIENELRLSRIQAEQANEAKGHFLANMSHEFRTPMNAIKGMVQLLQDSDMTSEQKENLRLIKSSVDSLLVIVNDILDFSKLDSVHMELNEDDLDLPVFLKEMRDIMDIGAMNKKISVELETKDIPRCVRVDSLRLRQVLTNLLGNSVKFTDEGGVVLRCCHASDIDERGKTGLLFEVSDTGIGLPDDDKDSLFESFVQADSSITRRYGGTGLGLAICYRLVKLMGGELTAANNKDGGATFSFVLYLKECSDESSGRSQVQNEDGGDPPDLSKLRILVAEDSRMNQILLRKIFEKHGITNYLIVENGKDCVDVFTQSEEYDVILMDIQMPVMDGFAAATAIRRLHSPVRIIALSANSGEDFKQKCAESGMDSRVMKPFDVDELLSELARAVAK